MEKSDSVELIFQRLKYLLYGNYHGVSISWLNRQNVQYQDLYDYFLLRGHDSKVILETLQEGSVRYQEACQKSSSDFYSNRYNSELMLSEFLYTFALLEKPRLSVETGVANGISTKVLMSALEQTGGILHSFDIDEEASQAYQGKGRWEFHKLPKNSTKKALVGEVANFKNIDLWLHDSNHGFSWQVFEYRLAIEHLIKTRGMLVSDDIDASTAWGILSKTSQFNFKMFFDSRKMVGFAKIDSEST